MFLTSCSEIFISQESEDATRAMVLVRRSGEFLQHSLKRFIRIGRQMIYSFKNHFIVETIKNKALLNLRGW